VRAATAEVAHIVARNLQRPQAATLDALAVIEYMSE
jgi:hypothetical protein